MTSFSEQLEALIASNTPVISERDELFFAELEATKQWLRDVFADENMQLLGYVGDPRFLLGTGHRLEIYLQANGLIFCLKLERYKPAYRLAIVFQLGFLRKVSSKTNRASCFQKIGSICSENSPYKPRLHFVLKGNDDWPKLPNDEPTLTELREALVATCFNALRYKLDLRDAEVTEKIKTELFEKIGFQDFAAELTTAQSASSEQNDELAYIASIDPDILNLQITSILSHEGVIEGLTDKNIRTVRDLLAYSLDELTFHQPKDLFYFWETYILAGLGRYDLELKPNKGE